MPRPLYVETLVRGDLDRLWSLTQDPVEHVRWDLRFSRITPTGRAPAGHETFEYALDLPGRTLTGTGTSVGERRRPDGTRTSALRFATADRLSLLRRGSGYWRYVPTADGVRFLTGYDYEPGWGRAGRVVDAVAFRPVLGWMTAWSFDRLRLWVERDQDPAASARRALADAGARLAALAVAARLAAGAVRPSPSRRPGAAGRVGRRPGGRRRTGPDRALGALPLVMSAALAVVAVAVPAPERVPRAGRCRRTPPERGAARAPGALDRLAAPVDRLAARGAVS